MHDRLVAEPIRLTYEDFCALPDDGRRYEILDGDLYISPSPMTAHQVVTLNLAAILRDHTRKRKLGRVFVAPYDVALGKHDIVEPDVIYVSKARASVITPKNIQGAPDLLVEVLPDATRERDLRDKRNLYARCGVPWYWIIDSAGPRVTELKLVDRAYAVVAEPSGEAAWTPALFPELTVRPAELLAE